MKQLKIILILLLLGSDAWAQTDSSYFYAQAEKQSLLAYKNATSLLASDVLRSGVAGFSYQSVSGHYRMVQQAEKQQVMKVATSGLATLGKFKLSGYFNFSRNYQDSLNWTTKGTELDAQPYYFASSKAGSYERTLYDVGGIMSYALLEDKIFIASGLQYSFQSSTRSVDPRPGVENFQLVLKPQLVYRFNTKHYLGLQANWGYGSEEYTLTFQNGNYQVSLAYPDRINYMIYGYGSIEIMQQNQRTLRRPKSNGLAINYAGGAGTYQFSASIGADRLNDNNYFRTVNSVTDNLIGTFVLDDWKADVLISKNGKDNQQLSIDLFKSSGQDKRVLYNAVNYRYDYQRAGAEYLIRLNAQRPRSLEIGASFEYQNTDKEDVVSAHHVTTSLVEPGISGTYYLKTGKNSLLSFGAAGGYRIPLSSSITVPQLQETVFTRGVVYGDYAYGTSRAFKGSFKLNYISGTLFKEFKTGFSLQGNYLNQVAEGIQNAAATFLPSGQRSNLNLGVNLYF
ncbi:MAG: hypothetical protein V4687_00780 [Bacteroidota bacterium]